ncbi:unnamed protein product [Calypogeia fissa]
MPITELADQVKHPEKYDTMLCTDRNITADDILETPEENLGLVREQWDINNNKLTLKAQETKVHTHKSARFKIRNTGPSDDSYPEEKLLLAFKYVKDNCCPKKGEKYCLGGYHIVGGPCYSPDCTSQIV